MKIENDHGVFYMKNGRLHRVSQPAVIWADGQKEWWYRGDYHRTDGPAIEHPDGSVCWYLFGKRYDSERDYNRALKYNVVTGEHAIINV